MQKLRPLRPRPLSMSHGVILRSRRSLINFPNSSLHRPSLWVARVNSTFLSPHAHLHFETVSSTLLTKSLISVALTPVLLGESDPLYVFTESLSTKAVSCL